VSANGKLNLPPYDPASPSMIHNITIFLYSYETGRNFTISNGTATANNETLGDIMLSEPGSTVKHVKWTWPECLIGDGKPSSTDSDRGNYNVSPTLDPYIIAYRILFYSVSIVYLDIHSRR